MIGQADASAGSTYRAPSSRIKRETAAAAAVPAEDEEEKPEKNDSALLLLLDCLRLVSSMA